MMRMQIALIWCTLVSWTLADYDSSVSYTYFDDNSYSYSDYSSQSYYYDDTIEDSDSFDNKINTRNIMKIKERSLGDPSTNTGYRVAAWSNRGDFDSYPEELGSYYQGDILYPRKDRNSRNGIVGSQYRWPGGYVPYNITGYFTKKELKKIKKAMKTIESKTCIRFVPYDLDHKDWVSIESGFSGCWSAVGRQGGKQTVNLQNYGCTKKLGTIMHELLHTIGFYHEQSRSDRDCCVTIKWSNIIPAYQHNFNKEVTDAFGITYDYKSVMHYSKKAFSKNNKITIKAKKKIGQRRKLSKSDIKKVKAMYNC